MGVKSLKVPQPEFSHWVIRRRQELGFSPAGLSEKLHGKLSERTLKYLEGGKKETFSEYTLTILAQGLELTYPDLLCQIDELPADDRGGWWAARSRETRTTTLLTMIVTAILSIALFWETTPDTTDRPTADAVALQDVLIHADYPHIIFAQDAKGNTLWQKNLDTQVIKVDVTDLDGDGNREVVAATYKKSYGDWGERPGWLLVWNEKGDLLTEQNMWKPSIYPAKESYASINDFAVVDLDRDETPEIVAIIRGLEYYPSRLAVLHYEDFRFEEAKNYWNPGFIIRLLIEDMYGDGFPEIICSAVNNDLKRVPAFGIPENVSSVFMLDGK